MTFAVPHPDYFWATLFDCGDNQTHLFEWGSTGSAVCGYKVSESVKIHHANLRGACFRCLVEEKARNGV